MANVIYNSAKQKLMDGSIDLDTDTIKVALVTASYSPSQDDHEFFDDITNEVTSSNYAAGGSALANKAVTKDNTNNRGVFDADDLSWSSVTFSPRAAIIYKDTGNAATSPLIAYIDFGSDQVVSSGTFSIHWSSSGILYVG